MEKILSDSRGVTEISSLSPSKGETIHIYEQDIKIVKAKEEIKKVYGIRLVDRIKRKLKFLKLNYTDIYTNEKGKLPKWLKIKI